MILLADFNVAPCSGIWAVNDSSKDHMSSVTYVVCSGIEKTICGTMWTGGTGTCSNDEYSYYD